MKHYNWSLFEMDSLIPWEKEIYIDQLKRWIDEQEQNK